MSAYADRGTRAHWVLEQALWLNYEADLEIPTEAASWIGESIDVIDGPHSALSPSGAKGWMQCPAWAVITARHPEKIDTTPRPGSFTEEDARAVQRCLDYVRDRVMQLKLDGGMVDVLSEHKVSPEFFLGTKECNGTVDITLVTPEFIEIIDYKHGAGIPVAADDPQLALYLLGAIAQNPCPRRARRTIVQPRCDRVDPVIRYVDVDDVEAWIDEFAAQAQRALDEVTAARRAEDLSLWFRPSSDACRWCPAGGNVRESGAPVCKAYTEYSLAQLGAPLSNELPAVLESSQASWPDQLSAGHRLAILDSAYMIRQMVDAVEHSALIDLYQGRADLGLAERYKVVHARTQRRYAVPKKDVPKAMKSIRGLDPETSKRRCLNKRELFEEVLRSPAKMEKALKLLELSEVTLKAFYKLIEKPEGKPALAGINDPRPAIADPETTVQDMFDNPPEAPKELSK